MRIAIQQPALPSYRVPLFRAMTKAMPEHDITLYYGSEEPGLLNADPDLFQAVFCPFKMFQLPIVGELRWHPIQWKLVDKQAADVVVLSWNIRAVSFWLALFRAKVNRVPVIIWGHGYSKSGSSRVVNWIRSVPLTLSAGAVFYDANTAANYDGEVKINKVHVAHNGLDSETIQRARTQALQQFPQPCDARTHLQLGDGPVLIYIGRLMQANRLDLMIESLRLIVQEHPGVVLVVVGGGEASYKKQLNNLISTLELDARVVWAGPLYSEAKLAPWMVAADVFVYPSNVGLSLIHAFNYGIPAVICAPLSQHNPEVAIVENGVNTIIARDQSPAALSQAALELLGEPAMARRMGDSARLAVLKTHNVDNMVKVFGQVFDQMGEDVKA